MQRMRLFSEMMLDYDSAVRLFSVFNDIDWPPAFHPYYIVSDSKRDESLVPAFFAYQNGGDTYYHGFLLGKIPNTSFFDIQSPYGYGGPIATTEKPSFLDQAWSAYSAWCIENEILAEFVRFHPLAENWHYYHGTVLEDRQTVWIDTLCDDLLMSYDVRSRTAVRKAYKDGLRVEWSQGAASADTFRNMYNDAMKRVDADHSYFYRPAYFETLLAWEKSELAICKKDDDVVAMSIFQTGNRVMEYHLSASTEVGRRHAATNLMIHEAALRAKQRGCTKLHLGGGTDGKGNNQLLFFKAGFSSNRGIFKIGKQIHNLEAYDDLRNDWLDHNGKVAEKVLFYRFED
jgi:hypothetical protein